MEVLLDKLIDLWWVLVIFLAFTTIKGNKDETRD